MLPSGLSWAAFASFVLGVSCANDFVTNNSSLRSFPSQFGAGRTTTIYWTNLQGFIAGIYVDGNGQSDDSAWVLGWSTYLLRSLAHLTPPPPPNSHRISTRTGNLHEAMS